MSLATESLAAISTNGRSIWRCVVIAGIWAATCLTPNIVGAAAIGQQKLQITDQTESSARQQSIIVSPVKPPILETPIADRKLDIQQAVSLATDNDPGYQRIHWAIEKAKGQRFQTTRYPNPTAGFTGDEIGNVGSAGQYGVFWSQSVVRNNRQAIQHRYFSLEIAALQRQFDIRQWEIARTIGTRFLTASRFQEEYRIVTLQIESLEEILEITKQLFVAGEISNIGVANIELEIETMRQELVESGLKREFELRALAIPLGIAVSKDDLSTLPDIQLKWSETTQQLMDPAGTALAADWLYSHPQINFANAEAEQSRVQIEIARAEQCPDVELQGALTYDMLSDDVFAGFQIGLPMMKYDRKRGLIQAANAEYQRRMETVRLKEMQLQSAYTIGEGNLAILRSRVSNIRNVIIPKAIKNLQQIRGAFEVGEAEFLLLKTGIDMVRKSQIQLLDAEYELAVAAVNLRTLLLDD